MDKELLEAMSHMMDAKLGELRSEIQGMRGHLHSEIQAMGSELRSEMQSMGGELRSEMQEMKHEIVQQSAHNMKVLLETEVSTKFDLLVERQDEFFRRMPTEEDMDIIDGRLGDLEADVARLKKAN